MTVVNVNSRAIRSYEYNAEKGELTLTYKSGKPYIYTGVPKSVVDGLESSTSIGSYVVNNISGKYPFKR